MVAFLVLLTQKGLSEHTRSLSATPPPPPQPPFSPPPSNSRRYPRSQLRAAAQESTTKA